jgi:glycosyltransferase involved in cell wall biosynthesis
MFVESDVKISFAILTHNEGDCLRQLLNQLSSIKSIWDEIVIVDDCSNNKETIEILTLASESGCVVKQHALNNDFSKQKNYLNSLCKNEYIFNIDADELLDPEMAKTFRQIIALNPHVDVFKVPRVNTVKNITLNHISSWRWNIGKLDSMIEESNLIRTSDEYKFYKAYNLIIEETDTSVKYFIPIINFPDYQYRIYKNKPSIIWIGKVHEIISGYNTYGHFPLNKENSILHYKDIKKQEQQNNFYSELK